MPDHRGLAAARSASISSLLELLSIGSDSVTIRVLARPGAPHAGLLRVDSRGLVIGLGAPPERGKANAELVETVARMAGVRRSAVEVVTGSKARQKSVRIMTGDPAGLAARLRALAERRMSAADSPWDGESWANRRSSR